jgi:hypothetical protein
MNSAMMRPARDRAVDRKKIGILGGTSPESTTLY